MSDGPPERITFSIPPDDPLHEQLDELVEQSEYASRSRFIRAAIRGDVDLSSLTTENK